MKVTPKRKRSDSTQAQVEAMQAAAAPVLSPPAGVTLRKVDAPFWKSITEARARSTWTDIDLQHAATLARTLADVEKMQALIDEHGYFIAAEVNPAFVVLEKLSRRAMALSRMLHVHALATVGRSADSANAAELEREARETAARDDGLIPVRVLQ